MVFPCMRAASLLLASVLLAVALFVPAGGAPDPAGPRPEFLRIESRPAGALVTVDGMFIGMTPVVYPLPAGVSGPLAVTVSATGHHSFSTTYTPGSSQGRGDYIFAELAPTESLGTIVVKSRPPGALTMVDGGKGQQAPWTYSDVRAGGHLVQAYLSGYRPYIGVVDVPDGGTVVVEATLAPLSEVGTIQVKSSPGGADIYVDGIYRGSTAATVGNLAAGTHFVLLRAAGYRDWTGLVEVKKGEVTSLDLALEPSPGAESGFVTVDSVPPGASVYLDGLYRGTTQPGDLLDLTGISPGNHSLKLTLDRYADYTVDVQVRPGETTRVHAVLAPRDGAGNTSVLQVTSEPSGAFVTVDGSLRGITPLSVCDLPGGPHEVRLSLPGYIDSTLTFTHAPGTVSRLDVALAPQQQRAALHGWVAPFALVLAAALAVGRRRPPRSPL
ncbi:MAG: PEGA domain-containing protein [Methanolinea sp.]|nr:PEGA domain-containing protein [Methanolinea sp.]